MAIITSEVNIPNTLGRDPCSHSSPVNCRIPCGERRASKAARSQKSRRLGKLFSSARILGPGQATSCEYCDPDPKHKPDPGLGFHFQFLNSLSHQISSDRLSQDGRLILHSQFYLGLNLGIFLETDYRGGFSGINLNSADEMLCPRVKSYQSDGPEDYSKQSSW